MLHMDTHHKRINYLGPPTTSPSSPTAGAAGARALGSVPGAALQFETIMKLMTQVGSTRKVNNQ